KRRAWDADCGKSPEDCMHERTEALTGLTGQDNPYYSSVDAWSFSVALHRAQAYYPARLNQEYPASDAPLEQARSAIRRHYYAYASNLIAQAYVYESDENFEAYFPLMPRNTDEMRETSLYYEDVYPITEDEEGFWHMHAWDACPGMEDESFLGYGSVAQWEAEEMDVCEVCEFSASRVGSVASASTNISNGFEYHYQIVAHEAQLYQQERARLAQESRAAKDPVEGVFETLSRLLKEAFDYRIEVYPPGNIGAIALVIDTSLINSASVVPNSLVSSSATLGPRFAVSAASLADDDANEADTVITHLLDGVFQGALASSIPGAALDIWSRFLCVYSSGHTSFLSHIETTLNSLPLLGAAGLGTWAAERLKSFVDDVGLAPPDLVSHKPVLVNSYHVARVDQNSFTSGLLSAKQAIGNAYGGLSQDPLSACVGIAGGMLLTAYDDWDATFVIARIELFGSSGPSIPLEVTLPTSMKGAGRSVIENVLSSLLAQTGQMVEVRRWE
ncbi:MAG: molybdenum cofactor biosynthesis enzyme, partial [Eggerthellaceae bacterium]|nr:molybdenum cofactor biosynthesis enzyme [Eggerthellaceae bacterium]